MLSRNIPQESAGILNESADNIKNSNISASVLHEFNSAAQEVYSQYMQQVSANIKKNKLQSQQEAALTKKLRTNELAIKQELQILNDQNNKVEVPTVMNPVGAAGTTDGIAVPVAKKKLVVKVKSTSSS